VVVVHHLAGTVTDLLLGPCYQLGLDAEKLVGIAGDARDTRSDTPPNAPRMGSGCNRTEECWSSTVQRQIVPQTAACIGQ
jgi:hypothetical protein